MNHFIPTRLNLGLWPGGFMGFEFKLNISGTRSCVWTLKGKLYISVHVEIKVKEAKLYWIHSKHSFGALPRVFYWVIKTFRRTLILGWCQIRSQKDSFALRECTMCTLNILCLNVCTSNTAKLKLHRDIDRYAWIRTPNAHQMVAWHWWLSHCLSDCLTSR